MDDPIARIFGQFAMAEALICLILPMALIVIFNFNSGVD